MTRTLVLLFFLGSIFFGLVSCTSLDNQDEEDVIAALEEEESDDLGDVDDEDDSGDEGDMEGELAEGEEDEEDAFDENELDDDSEEETVAENEESAAPVEEEIEEEIEEEKEEPEVLAQNEEEGFSEEDFQKEEEPPSTKSESSTEILNIKYLAEENGGSILIEMDSEVEYSIRSNPGSNQFIVDLQNAQLPDRLKRPYLFKEFEGSFLALDAYQKAGDSTARVVIQYKKGEGEPLLQRTGGGLLVLPSRLSAQRDIAPPQELEVEEPEQELEQEPEPPPVVAQPTIATDDVLSASTLSEFLTGNNRYYGKPISIQLNDAEVRDVIHLISEESGANIVISDDVKGKVSLKLREIPWDQALVIVMRSKQLGYLRQGNVLRVSTLKRLQEEADVAKGIILSQEALVPLKVMVIPISFAKVEEIVKQLSPFLTPTRGKVVADGRTSSIIVTDTGRIIDKIKRLIRELDIPPAQVMIEGKIVEASEQFTRKIGVNWGLRGAPVTLSESGGNNGGAIDLIGNVQVAPISQDVLEGSAGVFGLSVGTFDFIGSLDATLALNEQDNLVKVVASPRIVTINKEKAKITQEGEVISVTSIIEGTNVLEKVERSKIKLELEVLPQITSEGSVIMDVKVIREFPGPVVHEKTLARAVNSRSAKSKVLVKSGHTAILGGVYQSDQSETDTGIPGLKKIPILGWLFKSKSKERLKTELLIFLTPRILNIKDQGVKNRG